MNGRRQLHSFAAVMLLIGGVSATVLMSCGGGGGSSNGDLCQQCGDTDGPCNIAGADLSADQAQPSFCPNQADGACHVALACVRKVDSGQRRCYPVDPTTLQLDFFFECDGSRPIQSFAPTPVPTTTATATTRPSETATPVGTGPTATGPTPEATMTPSSQAEDVDVTVTVEDPNLDDLPTAFTGTVTYLASKGKFLQGGALQCDGDEGLTPHDDGNGTLTLAFALSDTSGISDVSITCTFHQVAGETLVDGDLGATVAPNTLTITIDPL